MAIHHAGDKRRLFEEVYAVLAPGGTLVFADHLAGAGASVEQVIGLARARVKLGAEPTAIEAATLAEFLATDARKQAAEGNRCESLARYLLYLSEAGFDDVDCLWRDHWLAVFVAKKS
jgi:SAM-dependent methyltransferase